MKFIYLLSAITAIKVEPKTPWIEKFVNGMEYESPRGGDKEPI